jgi:hypothetical protein
LQLFDCAVWQIEGEVADWTKGTKCNGSNNLMKLISSLRLAFVLAAAATIVSCARIQPRPINAKRDEKLTQQISEILKECQTIKPGMTRAELLKVFTVEGGLWTARHRTYVYRQCHYIKVDVDFDLSSPEQGALDTLPTDTIKKISQPYLQWAIID